MKEKGKGNIRFKIAAIIFVLIVASLYFFIYMAPKFSDAFVETYTAEFGTLDVDYKVDYVAVRNEKVHRADGSGSISDRVTSGSLVRRNTPVLTLGGSVYTAQIRGIVSYFYDGLEEDYTPDKISKMKRSSLYPKKDSKGKSTYSLYKCNSKSASQGEAIYKIVDNSEWYLVTWVKYNKASKIEEGKTVTIEFKDKDRTQIKFRVMSNAATGKDKPKNSNRKYKIVFSCDRYYKNFTKIRYGTARVITSQKSGIILESDSVTEQDGQKGVYVKNKYGKYVFTPISIIAVVGDKTVVESRTYYDTKTEKMISTVKNYDSIKKGVDSENVD